MKSLLRKIKVKRSIFVNVYMSRYFIGSPWIGSFFYAVFSAKFRRENYAVLNGKIEHLKNSKKANIYTLIRNTHRLEKGLLMRPRRDVFAADYIKETVDNFEPFYLSATNIEETQLQWSFDVLSEYFSVAGNHSIIDKQRDRFRELVGNKEVDITKCKLIPYHRQF